MGLYRSISCCLDERKSPDKKAFLSMRIIQLGVEPCAGGTNQRAYMQCFRPLGSDGMTDSYLRSLQDLIIDKLISSRLSTK